MPNDHLTAVLFAYGAALCLLSFLILLSLWQSHKAKKTLEKIEKG